MKSKKGRVLWLVFDLANGDGGARHPEARNYVWAYNTRKAARERVRLHKNNPEWAQLKSPPVKYVEA